MKRHVTKKNVSAIGIVMAVILLGVGVVVGGNLRQQASFTSTDERSASVRTISKAVFDDKSSNKERIDALSRLAALDTDGTCHGDWWNDWQQGLLGAVSKEAKECRATEDSIKTLSVTATITLGYIRDDTSIAAQVASLRIDTADKEWPQKALTTAQTASKKLDGMHVEKNAEPVLKEAKTRTGAIVSAWTAIQASDAKKDKAAYLAAETALKDAYAGLGAIADVSDAQVAQVIAKLKTAATLVK